MKITGIILFIFAALNFIVAIIATGNGAGDAAAQKFGASILLGLIGGVLYYFGNRKTKDKESKNTKQSNVTSCSVKHDSEPKPQQVAQANKPAVQPQEPNVSQTADSNTDEEDDYPKPLGQLTQSDMDRLMAEFPDQMLSIMADGGTKEQSQVKMELLLGKRSKTEGMLAIENNLRSFFRKIYESVGEETAKKSSNENPILRKIAITNALFDMHKRINDREETVERKQMREIANAYGVSINILDDEEFHRALSIYRDGVHQ